MKFILITDSEGRNHFVNVGQITNVAIGNDGKVINLSDGKSIKISMTIEEIVRAIQNNTTI
jgi:hypothetical protein